MSENDPEFAIKEFELIEANTFISYYIRSLRNLNKLPKIVHKAC